MKIKALILFLICSFSLSACLDQPDCVSKTTDFVNAKFYESESNEENALFVSEIQLMDTDTSFTINAEVTAVQLPLNPHTRSSRFLFNTELGVDTVELSYEMNASLISEDCGIELIYTLLEDGHGFDSVRVVNKILVEEITEDVKIFY